jgi:hypothetical protein
MTQQRVHAAGINHVKKEADRVGNMAADVVNEFVDVLGVCAFLRDEIVQKKELHLQKLQGIIGVDHVTRMDEASQAYLQKVRNRPFCCHFCCH